MKKYIDPKPAVVSLDELDKLYPKIPSGILTQYKYLNDNPKFSRPYITKLSNYARAGDKRLFSLKYDNSLASLRLWNFLLTEEKRLMQSRRAGKKIFGVMKDLGTVPVMVYSSKKAVAFYPEGAWWLPCFKEGNDSLLKIAEAEGIGEEVCPSRATLGAYINKKHFPIPDLNIAGVGSCCDDFSAIMQRIEALGNKFLWWEIPYRKDGAVSKTLEDFVICQLERIKKGIEEVLGDKITDKNLMAGIKKANRFRKALKKLRDLSYGKKPVPVPSLEMLICEMIDIHFCSDLEESINVIEHMLSTAQKRVKNKEGVINGNPYRITWVNPVADLKMMNLFEELGGTVAGTEYLFSHALEIIPENIHPMKALAKMILMDPMIGSAKYRAKKIIDEFKRYNAEGVIISHISGASHCASEGNIIKELIERELKVPVLFITVPSLIDGISAHLKTKIEAFFDIISFRRKK